MRNTWVVVLVAVVGCKGKAKDADPPPADPPPGSAAAPAAPAGDSDEVKQLGAKVQEAIDKIKPTLASKMPFLALSSCEETMPSVEQLSKSTGFAAVGKELAELCTVTAPPVIISWLVADMEKMKAEHTSDDQARWCYLSGHMRTAYAYATSRGPISDAIKAEIVKWNAVCTLDSNKLVE